METDKPTPEDIWYVVQSLRFWDSLEVMGQPLASNQYPGCVGFIPVFDSIETAVAWKDENNPTAAIVMIAPQPQKPAQQER